MKKIKLLFVLALIASVQLNAQFTLEVALLSDDYPQETSWYLSDDNGQLLFGGEYTAAENLYTQSVNVGEGDFVFDIFDTASDGVCCQYGEGYYQITETVSGQIIVTGGEFGGSESVSFSLPYIAPLLGCTDPGALNYDEFAEENDGSCTYLLNPIQLELDEIADGFNNPIDISHAGDTRLFIAEKGGQIKILNADGTTNGTPFLNISSLTNGSGEQGLLGMEFHPNYSDNGYFYINYTNNSGDSRIVRYSVDATDPNVADASSALTILSQSQPYGNHNAGDLKFGPDGYLYIPFGDGGSGGDPENRAQNPTTMLGKMLRIDVDTAEPYAIPPSNPFVDVTSTLDEIWAIGLRNTWRFSFDVETGDMWMGDVGQNVWEEIDLEPAGSAGGLNYGWRCQEGFSDYNTAGCSGLVLEDPISVYNHSGGACSVTGGYVYRGSDFPVLTGHYIYVDYCNGQFKSLKQNDAEEWISEDVTSALGFGWTSFGENSARELFVCNANGTIYQIKDLCIDHFATVEGGENSLIASEGDSYIWLLNGEVIEGETDQTLELTQSGTYSVVVELDNGCSAISDEIIFNGIDELNNFDFTISPNPVSDILNISVDGHIQINELLVYNVLGDVVAMKSDQNSNTNLNVASLENGVYIIEVRSNSGIVRSRFIVER